MEQGDNTRDLGTSAKLEEASALLALGQLPQAARAAQEVLAKDPARPHAWHLLSGICAKVGNRREALICAERAAALAATDPTFLIHLGQCLVSTGNIGRALRVADQVARMTLDRADWNDAIGTLFTFCEEPTRALPFFARAVLLSPQNGNFLYNLATAQRMTGDFSAAEATLDHVITLRPEDVDAYYTRATLRRQSFERNHVEEMHDLLNRRFKKPHAEIPLLFALAKELEDLGRYAESFACLERACSKQRGQLQYNVGTDVALIDSLIRLHTKEIVQSGTGYDTDECLFVIGLPRSGTTLVERILASHSLVTGAGELQAFPNEVAKAASCHANTEASLSECLTLAPQIDAAALGRAYLEATRPKTGTSPYFIDKQPINYLYAGLIRRALPRAKILAVVRDPADSCYAMYKTPFVDAYPFSYDLTELARYYGAWHRLMRHWRSVLGENLLVIQYEDLVANLEGVTHRILAHCGLLWEDTCVRFHEHTGAVSTASAVQVRQPLYTSSVGKWRHFELELRPLLEELKRQEPDEGWHIS